MKRIYEQIDEIPQNSLCTSCGTCVGICPKDALTMRKSHNGLYIPYLDGTKCNNCGLCLKVCPGHSVHFKEINKEIFDKLPDNPTVGNFLNCYIAYSSDSDLRLMGQSGGIVSSLLIFALEKALIDGAIVVRMNRENPLSPEVFIAKSRKEIIDASKSKYCSVPINTILKRVLGESGRYAMVGIPCQIHGIRKAQKIKKVLKKKIVLHFGLFCERTMSFLFQDYVLSKICAERRDVQEFVYRSKEWRGWPGDLLIRLKNGKTEKLSKEWRMNAKPFFTPQRCYSCFDKLNELADVSFGDAWLTRFRGAKRGISMLITRTKAGQEIVHRAIDEGTIKAQRVPAKDVIEAQKPEEKKLLLNSYLCASRLVGVGIPEYDVQFSRGSNKAKIGESIAFVDYVLCNVPNNLFTFKLLNYTPLIVLEAMAFLRRRITSFIIDREEMGNPYSNELDESWRTKLSDLSSWLTRYDKPRQ